MKKIFLLFAFIFTVSAYSQTTVYFGNLDSKVSIGVGGVSVNSFPSNPNKTVTLSIMQINKSKNFDDFSFRFINMDGEELSFTMVEDTLYHLDMDKNYSHQKDYTMSTIEYTKMCHELNNTSCTVYINNVEYTGAAFVGILRALEHEQVILFSRSNWSPQNTTFWHFPGAQGRNNIEVIRFSPENRNRSRKNNKEEFRYIRRPMFPPFGNNNK